MRIIRDFWLGLRAAFTNEQVQILLAMTAVLIGAASLFYRWVEGWHMLDAVYFSVMTISTVGYGDLTPQTSAGKIFTIFYVIFGLGLFVGTATSIAESIMSSAKDRRKAEQSSRS